MDTVVYPLELPVGDADELEVRLHDHTVTVTGPSFRREVTFPPEADVEHLSATLLDRVLELRAPRSDRPPGRTIRVHTPLRVHSDAYPD
jgi:HSP20 family molecular chaperone IbpA